MRYQVSVKLRKDFIEVADGEIAVGVLSPPEKGRANEEVVRKIAGYFRVPRDFVRIVSGRKARKKVVEIVKPMACGGSAPRDPAPEKN